MLAERLLAFSLIQEWPLPLEFGRSDLLFTVRHIAHHESTGALIYSKCLHPLRADLHGRTQFAIAKMVRGEFIGGVLALARERFRLRFTRNVKRLHRRPLFDLLRLRDEFFILRIVPQRRVRFQQTIDKPLLLLLRPRGRKTHGDEPR